MPIRQFDGDLHSEDGSFSWTERSVPSLYPNYVKDYHAFTDPDNPASDPTQATGMLAVNTLGTTTAGVTPLVTTTQHKFFVTEDAFDMPTRRSLGENVALDRFCNRSLRPALPIVLVRASDTTLAASCTSATTPATCAQDRQRDATYNAYNSQLRWRSQPGTTYVVCSTYHVPNAGLVIALFQDGPAKGDRHVQVPGGRTGCRSA